MLSSASTDSLRIAQDAIGWVRSKMCSANHPRAAFGSALMSAWIMNNRSLLTGMDWDDRLARMLSNALETGVGNCQEMALAAMGYVQTHYPGQETLIGAEVNESHMYLLIKARDTSGGWIVCDPWSDLACLWAEKTDPLAKLNRMLDEGAKKAIQDFKELMSAVDAVFPSQLSIPLIREPELEKIQELISHEIQRLIAGLYYIDPVLYKLCKEKMLEDPLFFYAWAKETETPDGLSIFNKIETTYYQSVHLEMNGRLTDESMLTYQKAIDKVKASVPFAFLVSTMSEEHKSSPHSYAEAMLFRTSPPGAASAMSEVKHDQSELKTIRE